MPALDPSAVKVIAFDLFGTVFDLTDVPREEIKSYVEHCQKPVWSPLELPDSWSILEPFPDSTEGINRLSGKFSVVTLSNCPLDLQIHLLENTELAFHEIIDLAKYQVFKPNPRAYMALCVSERVDPKNVLMVTANPRFGTTNTGDCQEAEKLGMQSRLIRGQTIIELAELLGC